MYTSRVLLSGIHLTNTGEVVGHCQLWHGHDLPYVSELIAAKREGEHRKLTGILAADRLANAALAELAGLTCRRQATGSRRRWRNSGTCCGSSWGAP